MVKLARKCYRGHIKNTKIPHFLHMRFTATATSIAKNFARISTTRRSLRSTHFLSQPPARLTVRRCLLRKFCHSRHLLSKQPNTPNHASSCRRLKLYTKSRGTGLKCSPAGILRDAAKAKISLRKTGAHFHAQAHISTQPPPPREDSRIPGAHEDQVGRSCHQPPSRSRTQARRGQRGLPRLASSAALAVPERAHQRRSG